MALMAVFMYNSYRSGSPIERVKPWHGRKRISCSDFKPRVTSDDIIFVAFLYAELVRSIDKAVVETVAVVKIFDFFFQINVNFIGFDWSNTGTECNAFAFLMGISK